MIKTGALEEDFNRHGELNYTVMQSEKADFIVRAMFYILKIRISILFRTSDFDIRILNRCYNVFNQTNYISK